MTRDIQVAPLAGRQVTLREFFAVMFRRRWIILGLFMATTTTVAAITLTTPAVFVSTGRVLLKRGEKESSLQASRRMPASWEEELASEIEIVHSSPVFQRAQEILDEDARAGRPAIRLAPRAIDAEVMGKSNVLALAYTDANPEVAQRACDAMVSAYVGFRQKSTALPYPRRFFEGEIERVGSELKRKAEERRRYENHEGVVDVSEQRRNLLTQLATLSDRRNQAETELAEVRTAFAQLQELRQSRNLNPPTSMPGFGGESGLAEINSQVLAQETRLAQLRERYRDDSPEVTAALTTLNTLKDMLNREVETRLALWESRVRVLEARRDVIARAHAVTQAELDRIPDKEARMTELDREIGLLKQRYADLVQRSDLSRVVENTTLSNDLIVLSPAGKAKPSNTRDYVRLALAPAFSLLIGIGLAFFVDGLDVTVRTAGHAEEAIQLPVLAAITERRRRSG